MTPGAAHLVALASRSAAPAPRWAAMWQWSHCARSLHVIAPRSDGTPLRASTSGTSRPTPSGRPADRADMGRTPHEAGNPTCRRVAVDALQLDGDRKRAPRRGPTPSPRSRTPPRRDLVEVPPTLRRHPPPHQRRNVLRAPRSLRGGLCRTASTGWVKPSSSAYRPPGDLAATTAQPANSSQVLSQILVVRREDPTSDRFVRIA